MNFAERCLLLFVYLAVASGSPQPPACKFASPFQWSVSSNCSLDASKATGRPPDGLFSIQGAAGALPVVHLAPGAVLGADVLMAQASISNVILLSSSRVPDNSISITDLLWPPLLRRGSTKKLSMSNVQLVYNVSAEQQAVAIATLRGVVSDPVMQQGLLDWSLSLYTDYASFVYVASWSSDGFTCSGCGMFLRFADSDMPTGRPGDSGVGANYLLGVNNDTFVPSLLKYGAMDTPRPFLMLLASNISWGTHPALAGKGSSMGLMRPVVLVGQAGVNTSVDLGMKVNRVLLTGQHSNVTLEGLVIENMAYGDSTSGMHLSGLSLINTFNMWFFYWDRQSLRIATSNVTQVAASQNEVEFLQYWNIMYSSSEPSLRADAAWMKRGPGITVWEAVVTQHALLDVKFVARSTLSKYTWRTATPLIAPRLPMQLTNPELYQQPLKSHAAAPLAALARTNNSLQNVLGTLTGLSREGLVVLMAPLLYLGEDERSDWPPPGGVVLEAPRTSIVGYTICPANSSSSNSSSSSSMVAPESPEGADSSSVVVQGKLPQEVLLAGLSGDAAAAASVVGVCHPDMNRDGLNTIDSRDAFQQLAHTAMLDLGQERDLLVLRPAAPGAAAVLDLHAVTLLGLAQGPAVGAVQQLAAAAASGRRRRRRQLLGWSALPAGEQQGSSSSSSSDSKVLLPMQQRWLALPSVAEDDQQQQQHAPSWSSIARDSSSSSAPSPPQQHQQHHRRLWWLRRQLLQASLPAEAATAAAARGRLSQATPDVWTHLLWAVRREGGATVNMSSVQLALPRPEFKRLLQASRSSADGSFVLQLQGNSSLTAHASSFEEGCCLIIQQYSGPGLTASKLLLLPDPDEKRSMPPGYYWPSEGDEDQAGGGQQGAAGLSPGALAGLIIGVLAAVLLLLAVLLCCRRRRRQRAAAAALAAAEQQQLKAAVLDGAQSSDSDAGPRCSHSSAANGAPGNSKHALALAGAAAAADTRWSAGMDGPTGRVPGSSSPSRPGSASDAAGGNSSAAGGLGGVLTDKRWLKLTGAISGKVQDIHKQRLRSALLDLGALSLAGSGTSGARTASDRTSPAAAAAAAAVLSSAAGGAAGGSSAQDTPRSPSSSRQQQQQGASGSLAAAGASAEADNKGNKGNVLQLKEVIGQGSFGIVYRATWQGVNVAVKLLQLPPGARSHALSSVYATDACGMTTQDDRRLGGLLRQEHMAVQEAAIGSTMMHPNIVQVYSITLRPAMAAGGAGALAAAKARSANSSSQGVLMLDEDDGPLMSMTPAQVVSSPPENLELLPWEMQLVMEFCDQGTLRDALDAQLLVERGSGCNHFPTVLSLAHNVACAMQYLHQEHIIHGDLKANNVLLKSTVPTVLSSSTRSSLSRHSSSHTQQHQLQQQSASPAATPAGGSSCDQQQQHADVRPASPTASGPAAAAPAVLGSTGSEAGSSGQLPSQPASHAILGAAAAAAEDNASGMYCLLKGGWVVAKVSDFGLSLCVAPDETHVSSVHAGTITHMAPELLMHGHCSKASDVYSYGILLWELATGGKAFAGVPRPLLGHCIVSEQMRPVWPPAMRSATAWTGVVRLAEQCWSHNAHARPTFAEVVNQLERLLKAPAGDSQQLQPTLSPADSSTPSLASSSQQQQPGVAAAALGGGTAGDFSPFAELRSPGIPGLMPPPPAAAGDCGAAGYGSGPLPPQQQVPVQPGTGWGCQPAQAGQLAQGCDAAAAGWRATLQPAPDADVGGPAGQQVWPGLGPAPGGLLPAGLPQQQHQAQGVMAWFQGLAQSHEESTAGDGSSLGFGHGMQVIPMVPSPSHPGPGAAATQQLWLEAPDQQQQPSRPNEAQQ